MPPPSRRRSPVPGTGTPDAPEPGSGARDYLLLRANGYDFLLPAATVGHLLPHAAVLPLAGAGHGPVAGFAVLGGAWIPVLDLGLLLGLSVTSGPAVILDRPVDPPEQRRLGLRVEAVVDRLAIPGSRFRPMRASSPLPFAPFVSSSWRGRSRGCYLLALDRLLPKQLQWDLLRLSPQAG